MASTYLTRTNGSAVAAERKQFTISFWVKRSATGVEHALCSAGNGGGSEEFSIRFNNSDQLDCFHHDGSNFVSRLITNRKFRDLNGWYHIYFVYDSPNGTAGDRMKLYVNGVEETSFATDTNPTQNDLVPWNVDERHQIGSNSWGNSGNGSSTLNGCMSHFYNIAGSNIAVTQFGSTDSTTGEWKINTSPTIASYGTAGFLVLKDGNTITDQSPNSNNFTVGGGTLTKTEDNPSNVFCTNNNLWKQESSRYLTHTIGNTMISGGGSATWYQTPGTLAFNSGKFYWECKWNAGTNLTQNHAGVIDYEKTAQNVQFRSQTGSVFFTNEDGGETWIDGSNSSADYGTIAQNDILGVAVDMDATTPTVKFYKNGSLHLTANAASLAGKFVTPAQMIYQSGEFQLNFGNGYFGTTAVSSAGTNASSNGIFEFDCPTGYTALSTKGLNL